jgi:hypothetical protein
MINLLKSAPNLERYSHNNTNTTFIDKAWKDTMFGNSILYMARSQKADKSIIYVPNNLELNMTETEVNPKLK